MADDRQGSESHQTNPGGGSGWGIRAPKDTANHDWDRQPEPLPPPVPALVHAPAPMLQGAPPPPPPPPSTSRSTPPSRPDLPRKQRNPMVVVGAVVIGVAVIAAGGLFIVDRSPETVVPLNTPVPSSVAVVHAGPAELGLVSLTGKGTTRTVKLPGTPDSILETPDRTKAFLLDSDHGDVIPVNLTTGQVGATIAVGKLPVDAEISANGATLYVTDNLGGTVIPINTSTGSVEPAQALTQGVIFYVPSPTTSGAVIGIDTGAGHPGVVAFYDPSTGTGSPLLVGSSPAESAFYSSDGRTVWVNESGTNGEPGAVIPIDVATHKPGAAIKLGVAPTSYALTPNRQIAVFANQVDNTVSIVNLATRRVTATVAVGTTPSGVDVDATGTTAWVTCALTHTLVPVNLHTGKAGAAIALGNAPGDLALPATAGTAWVLYPSSNGSINFLSGTVGPFDPAIPVGNSPEVMIGTGSETSWVANALNNTVQRIDVLGGSSGPAIPVAHAPNSLKLTPDGSSLLVLSYGDGHHAGTLTSIDTATSKISDTMSVGPAPEELATTADGAIAYIASFVARTITVVDLLSWHVTATWRLPCGPSDLAITPDDSQLFVACADDSALVAVRLVDSTAQAVIPVASVRTLVMPQTGSNLLVVGDNGLQNVNINTDKITKSVTETGNFVDVVETTDGSTILALDNSGAALVWIDPATLVTAKSLAVGTRPEDVVLSPDGTRAYVLDTSLQKLFVIDVSLWKLQATLSVSPDATGVVVPSPVVVPTS